MSRRVSMVARRILGAALQARFQLGHRRRQDEDRDDVGAHLFAELLGALPVDVEQHVAALAPSPPRPARAACRRNCRAPRPIPAAHRNRAAARIRASTGNDSGRRRSRCRAAARVVTLTDSSRLGSVSSRLRAMVDLPAPDGEDSTSISPRRRMPAEAPSAAIHYSRFCTCSRNWSTTAFSSSPIAVSDAAFDLEHRVFDSRLNSCARKSSLRPTGAAIRQQCARRGDMRLQPVDLFADIGLGRQQRGFHVEARFRRGRWPRRAAAATWSARRWRMTAGSRDGSASACARQCLDAIEMAAQDRAERGALAATRLLQGRRAPCRSAAQDDCVGRGADLVALEYLGRFEHAAQRQQPIGAGRRHAELLVQAARPARPDPSGKPR